jgi:hypothetical protein
MPRADGSSRLRPRTISGRLFTSALDEMRARYLVTFAPRSPTPGWHELKVSVRRGGVDVKARPGYFVSSPK